MCAIGWYLMMKDAVCTIIMLRMKLWLRGKDIFPLTYLSIYLSTYTCIYMYVPFSFCLNLLLSHSLLLTHLHVLTHSLICSLSHSYFYPFSFLSFLHSYLSCPLICYYMYMLTLQVY